MLQAPNCRSYTALIKLCALGAANGVGDRAIEKAFFIFQRMRDRGILPDVVVFNTLIDAYAKAAWAGSGGGIGPALEVLELMKDAKVQPNTVTYTSLINAARHQGTHEAVTVALALFRKMPAISRNHQTYTVMMHAMVSSLCAGGGRVRRLSLCALSCCIVSCRGVACRCVLAIVYVSLAGLPWPACLRVCADLASASFAVFGCGRGVLLGNLT